MRSTSRRASSLVCGALLCATLSQAATAAPSDDTAGAPSETFATAVSLFKEGDAKAALPMFERLSEQTDSPNVQLYLGYCHLELGQLLMAHEAFSAAVRLSEESRDEKYQPTKDAAMAERDRLASRLATIAIDLSPRPPLVTLWLDGRALPTSALRTNMVVEPGHHRIDVRAPNRRPLRQDVMLPAGAVRALALSLERLPSPAASLPARSKPAAEPTLPPSRWRPSSVGWTVAGGLGLMGLGTFAVAGLKARGIHDELQAACPAGCADDEHRARAARGNAWQNLANVGLAVGVAGALASAGFYYWGGDKLPEARIDTSGRSISLSYGGVF